MKVLVVTQYFWPENFRINDLVEELQLRGHEVSILTGVPNYPKGELFEEYRNQPEDFMAYCGAMLFRVPLLTRGSSNTLRLVLNYLSFVFSAALFGAWKLRQKEFDVIFVYEPSPVTVALPAIWIGKLKRAPVVFWVLDLWPETLSAVGAVRNPRILGSIGKLVGFIYKRCTLILGQSRSFIEGIGKYTEDKGKVRYFPSWSEDHFNDLDVNRAEEIPVKEDVFNILFAGNIGEAQDMPSILDAAETLKENVGVRWLIVGDGRKSDWLEEEVERRDLKERVLLLGRHSMERMPSFYAHADALLVSLKRDPVFSMTIPAKLQSYFLAGIPVLGMLDGEGKEIIQRAQAGLVSDAGDHAGLAANVLELTALGESERQHMGQRGRSYALKEFDRAELVSRLEGFFDEAVYLYHGK